MALSKYLASLLLLNIIIILTAFPLYKMTCIEFKFIDLIWLLFFFSIIGIISMYIFFRGYKKEPESATMHMMVSFGIKLLLEMLLALVLFFVAKKDTLAYLILFFVLYLAFTLFSTYTMLKALKTKSL